MLMTAIVLFLLAAVLGLYLLSFVLQDKNTPKGIAFIHGPVAATALIFLILYAYAYNTSLFVSVILFILAALGGLILIVRDMTGRSIPKWLAVGHGLTAITGFITLIYFAFFS